MLSAANGIDRICLVDIELAHARPFQRFLQLAWQRASEFSIPSTPRGNALDVNDLALVKAAAPQLLEKRRNVHKSDP